MGRKTSFTPDEDRDILRLRRMGATCVEIGRAFGVSPNRVSYRYKQLIELPQDEPVGEKVAAVVSKSDKKSISIVRMEPDFTWTVDGTALSNCVTKTGDLNAFIGKHNAVVGYFRQRVADLTETAQIRGKKIDELEEHHQFAACRIDDLEHVIEQQKREIDSQKITLDGRAKIMRDLGDCIGRKHDEIDMHKETIARLDARIDRKNAEIDTLKQQKADLNDTVDDMLEVASGQAETIRELEGAGETLEQANTRLMRARADAAEQALGRMRASKPESVQTIYQTWDRVKGTLSTSYDLLLKYLDSVLRGVGPRWTDSDDETLKEDIQALVSITHEIRDLQENMPTLPIAFYREKLEALRVGEEPYSTPKAKITFGVVDSIDTPLGSGWDLHDAK